MRQNISNSTNNNERIKNKVIRGLIIKYSNSFYNAVLRNANILRVVLIYSRILVIPVSIIRGSFFLFSNGENYESSQTTSTLNQYIKNSADKNKNSRNIPSLLI